MQKNNASLTELISCLWAANTSFKNDDSKEISREKDGATDGEKNAG